MEQALPEIKPIVHLVSCTCCIPRAGVDEVEHFEEASSFNSHTETSEEESELSDKEEEKEVFAKSLFMKRKVYLDDEAPPSSFNP